jgi:fructose-1-phosphate kinase PfkB-like protein
LNAAFVWALEQSDNFADAIRWAVAAGTASARLPGISFASLDQAREVYAQVQLK